MLYFPLISLQMCFPAASDYHLFIQIFFPKDKIITKMPFTVLMFTAFLKLTICSSGLMGGVGGSREVVCFKMKTGRLGEQRE